MKHICFKHLFTALLLLCATVATAHDFEVGGIYYNIFSETDKTVEVTSGTNRYTGSVVIPETVTMSESSTKTFDAWTSTNKSNSTTSQTSYTLNVAAGNILKFDWSVSSESNYDWLIITLDGTEIVKKSGTLSGSYEKAFDAAGSHTLVVKYTKDGSQSSGNDEGKIYNVTLNGDVTVDVEYRVTWIGNYAFSGCTRLTSVTIPNSVEVIDRFAFYGCTGLTSITIPNSTSIGGHAFEGTAWFDNQPDGVVYAGKVLYKYKGIMPSNTSITIKDGTLGITEQAFNNSFGLTSITIPNSVEYIGPEAFCYCTALRSLTSHIPADKLITPSYNAFYNIDKTNCTLYVPYGAKETYAATAGWNEFANIVELEPETIGGSCGDNVNWNLKDGVLTISGSGSMDNYSYDSMPWYEYKSKIKSVIINSGVTSIGKYAFYYCTGLTSITIPNSVTSIGSAAFCGCTGLTSIEIPNSVTSIGDHAFGGCTGLTSIEIPNSVTSIGSSAFSYCSGLTSIVIGNSVTSIGEEAFRGCTGLTSIVIPNNVTSIGNFAFNDCTSLKELRLEDGAEVLFWGYSQKEYIDEVRYSFTSLFYLCPLETVYIGRDFYYADFNENTAISRCFNGGYLTSVTIGNSVTSIAPKAFSGCSGLTSIIIPNSVTSIGDLVFEGCRGLTSIISLIPAENLFSVTSSYVFYGINKTNCTLYVPYGAKETYAATDGWNEFTNIVELEPTATEVTVTINQYGSATYCSPYALDFSEVEGLKAYNAIGYKPSTQTVTLARVMTTGAGQGVFIKGESGEYTVPVIDNFDEYTLNLLVGTLKETTVNSTDGAMSNYKFTIADGDAAPMFYPFEDGTTLSAGKAYLQIPTAWLPATAQKSLSVRFDDGETTGIDELKGESGEVKTIYDLSGRVVENPTSGIYIIDGKKVLVK